MFRLGHGSTTILLVQILSLVGGSLVDGTSGAIPPVVGCLLVGVGPTAQRRERDQPRVDGRGSLGRILLRLDPRGGRLRILLELLHDAVEARGQRPRLMPGQLQGAGQLDQLPSAHPRGCGDVGPAQPGGVLADRFDRRILRAWSAGIGLALSPWLAGLAAFGWLDVWSLVNIGFLLQLRASLFTPASEAMLRTVVHKRQLAQAVANNQGRDAAVSLVSGPLGGVLLAWGRARHPGTLAIARHPGERA